MPIMPNCIGLEYEAALSEMSIAGVRILPLGYFKDDPVTISWVKSTKNPGTVTAQVPSAGSILAVNSKVALTCAQFPMSVSYPGGETNI